MTFGKFGHILNIVQPAILPGYYKELMPAICALVLLQRQPEKVLIDDLTIFYPHVGIRPALRARMKRSNVTTKVHSFIWVES